ncbi:MAG: hypothetical protein ACK4V2_05980 [Pseudomonadota bacterium]|jgi:hypothetical protein|nr:hypothetical protein [Alphaproteobacteria bacterium]
MKKYTLALLAATILSSSLVAMERVELTPDGIRAHFANPPANRHMYDLDAVRAALDRGPVGVGAANLDLYHQARDILLYELTNPAMGVHGLYFPPECMEMEKTQLADAEINDAFMNAVLETLNNPGGPNYNQVLDDVRAHQAVYRQDILNIVAAIN